MSDNNKLQVVTPRQEMGLDTIEAIATHVIASGRFSTDTSIAQAVVKIQAGKELGLQPIQSMNNIIIVNGRITLGAALVGALVKASGRYWFKVVEHTNDICSIEFLELFDGKWQSCGVSTFTIEDAKIAGLLGKDVWKKWPRNMLHSRAMTNGARWFTPDVFGGPIYTPEEMDEVVVINDVDDMAGIDFDDFVKKVQAEMHPSQELDWVNIWIKNNLKENGFSWMASSKRKMFTFLRQAVNAEDEDFITIEAIYSKED